MQKLVKDAVHFGIFIPCILCYLGFQANLINAVYSDCQREIILILSQFCALAQLMRKQMLQPL